MNDPIIPTRSRRHIESDVRAELTGWVEERTAALVADGIEPERARSQAQREFGDMAAATRYCEQQDVAADRSVRARLWIEELFADARIAARTLLRTPTVTAVVLITFALGIGATTAVFSVVHAILLRELPYGDEHTFVALPSTNGGLVAPGGQLSVASLSALRERTSAFSNVGAIAYGGYTLTGGGEPELVTGGRLTSDAMQAIGAHAALGRTFITGDDSAGAPPIVLLSDGIWRRRFGADTTIVGRDITVSGAQRRVVGVMPRNFRLPTMEETEMWSPLDLSPVQRDMNRAKKFRFIRVFARMKAGVTLEVAQADVDRTMRALESESPDAFSGIGAKVTPIRTAVAGFVKPRLVMLMGAAAFVLLIACANIAGVLLARGLSRRHELGVRVALGAGRRRLARQFLAEGGVLTFAGAVLGVGVASIGIMALRRVASGAVPAGTTFSLEPQVLAFAVAAAVICGILVSLVPAVSATRVPGATIGSGESRGSTARSRRALRIGLVAGQLAVSIALLVAAGLFVRSLRELNNVDLGYRTDHVLTFSISLPGARYKTNESEDQFWPALYTSLGAIPGVSAVGAAGNVPLGGSSSSGLAIEGEAPPANGRIPEVKYGVASEGYFAALNIPLVRGQMFSHDPPPGSSHEALISSSLAKTYFGEKDPVGAHIRLGPDPSEPWTTIVGIVGDVRLGAAGAMAPTVYISQRQDHWRGGAVVLHVQGDPAGFSAAIRRAVAATDPLLPVSSLQTFDEFHALALSDRRMQMQLLLVFAALALALSALGVYGVSAYAVEARRREFGIRMALGATRRHVLRHALLDAGRAAGIGALVGIPLALGLAIEMRSLLYKVRPTDPVTVIVAVAALCVVVLCASMIPARRAAHVDPARTIRSD